MLRNTPEERRCQENANMETARNVDFFFPSSTKTDEPKNTFTVIGTF
jgi:hypothetical protein